MNLGSNLDFNLGSKPGFEPAFKPGFKRGLECGFESGLNQRLNLALNLDWNLGSEPGQPPPPAQPDPGLFEPGFNLGWAGPSSVVVLPSACPSEVIQACVVQLATRLSCFVATDRISSQDGRHAHIADMFALQSHHMLDILLFRV